MINKLRKKMIWVSISSLVLVFALIFSAICIIGTQQLNTTLDMLTDRISAGGGFFLPFDKDNPRPPDMDRFPGFFTAETPFSTRFFVVQYDESGKVDAVNTDSVSSVSQVQAMVYAAEVVQDAARRGWKDGYRYKIFETPRGQAVVFVDGSMNRATTRTLLLTSGVVLIGSAAVILILIILLSKRAIRPMVETYEKQKQFITDANHELKTPLTLILTNLDILEAETGQNEWLEDIRVEGKRLSLLANQLTSLCQMDEDGPNMLYSSFPLSEMVGDTVSEFMSLIQTRGLEMHCDIQEEIEIDGDEAALRRVVAILLDNAIKYCDPQGTISLSLKARRHKVLTVENSCTGVDNIELGRLFDRFYRADKARTASGSFGIGLSLAQSIIEKHGGEISAYKAGADRIGFKVVFK